MAKRKLSKHSIAEHVQPQDGANQPGPSIEQGHDRECDSTADRNSVGAGLVQNATPMLTARSHQDRCCRATRFSVAWKSCISAHLAWTYL